MSRELDHTPAGQGTAVVSLAAVITCALATEAFARHTPNPPRVSENELSARVAAIVERIRLLSPTLVGDLPPDLRIAQWRN